MSTMPATRKGPKKSGSSNLTPTEIESRRNWEARQREDRRRGKALFERLTTPIPLVGTVCATCRAKGFECCEHFVGIDSPWVQRLIGAASLLANRLYEEGDPYVRLTDESMLGEEAAPRAQALIYDLITEINAHLGGPPRFPLHFPLIDGQDREWAQAQQKNAQQKKRAA